MTPLHSSALKSADYDKATEQLTLEFHGGGTYHYDKVPADVFRGLVQAESAGKYFQTAIRGTYEHSTPEDEG